MTPQRLIGPAAFAVLLIAIGGIFGPAPASEFITIGPGSAWGLSANGSVVFTSEGRWTREQGFLPLSLPFPAAVSGDGLVVVGNVSFGGQPYRWTAETGIEPLGAPPNVPVENTNAQSISGDGKVISGYITQPARDAWIWTAEDGYRFLGGATRPSALSRDGRVAVGYTGTVGGTGVRSAFRWTVETGPVSLGSLGGATQTVATDVSPDGSVVVGISGSNPFVTEGFRWTQQGGIKGLGALPGDSSSSAGYVSADGLVIAGGSGSRTFVWDEVHGMRDLDKALREDYGLTQLPPGSGGISKDRRAIVGSHTVAPNMQETWVVYLDHPIGPPLPEFGDYNADGKVGQPDLNLVLGKWGQAANTAEYPWINDLPTGSIDQNELSDVVLSWPAAAGPLNLTLGLSNGALTANYDLKTNAAIIDYTGASPAATVRQQILVARGGPGLGKPWNGPGITSSTAATANATEPESRSVGYAENGALPLGPYTTFRGQAVDNTSILMAYTRTGDANLDGLVNDDDVTIVGASYAPGVPNASWALGDFDYNGFVDDDDVTLLGAFYDPSATPLIAAAPPSATAVTAVPEPPSLTLALFAMVVAVTARRRRIALRKCLNGTPIVLSGTRVPECRRVS